MHTAREQYYSVLQNISEGDLKYVERDLALYEKVSLSFLLFGGSKVTAQYALQRLLVLVNSRNEQSDILENYAKSNSNWRNSLVEALSIIGANKILRKLGFSRSDLKLIFLPHVAEVSLYIHPVLKALFFMCNDLNPAEAGRLVLEVNVNETSNHIRFYDHQMLEVYILDWLTKDIINVGEWPNARVSKPQLEIIFRFLKTNEKDRLEDILSVVVKNLNKPLKEEDETRTYRNENDNSGPKKNVCSINSNEQYIIRKEFAGFIVIFNQKNFYRDENKEFKNQLPELPLKMRKGTDKDRDELKSTFATFGYIPITIDDCSHMDMMHKIKDYVDRSVIYDSLIICILSHGIEGAVYGNNSVPVEIQAIQTIMASDSLLNKPKMLIVQACQEKNNQIRKEDNYAALQPSAVARRDMLTAIATIPGYTSIRHIETGTWFIQILCKLVNQLGDRKHMLDILVAVTKEVGKLKRNHNEYMVPQSSQTLQKSFFLPKRF